jgi:hypothetical protein
MALKPGRRDDTGDVSAEELCKRRVNLEEAWPLFSGNPAGTDVCQ